MAQAVTLTIDEGLASLRLGRAHGNAINEELVRDLTQACAEIEGHAGIRGVLLAAQGKLFCPGLDLQELVELDRDAMHAFTVRFNACVLALYRLSRPVVAALHGHAVAGGCVLGLTADWRVLAEGALVGLNEVRVGVPFPWGVAMLLKASVPHTRLEEVALFGRNYSGPEAIEAGLVHEVQPVAGFEGYCLQRLAELAGKEANALAVTKRYLRRATAESMRAGDAELTHEFVDSWFRPETRQRVMEVVERLRARDRS
jgi:enoyl-CoA hydratase